MLELQIQGPQEENREGGWGAVDEEITFRHVEFVGPVSWWGMNLRNVTVRLEKERGDKDTDVQVNCRQKGV